MDYEDAVNMILMHSIGREDVPLEQALYRDGFIGCLRSFSGLREENFLHVMEAIIALRPHLAAKREWEVRLVEGLWGLVITARIWGLDPSGLLQRNRLLSHADTKLLQLWVSCLEMAVGRLMRGRDPAEVLVYYCEQRGHAEATNAENPGE